MGAAVLAVGTEDVREEAGVKRVAVGFASGVMLVASLVAVLVLALGQDGGSTAVRVSGPVVSQPPGSSSVEPVSERAVAAVETTGSVEGVRRGDGSPRVELVSVSVRPMVFPAIAWAIASLIARFGVPWLTRFAAGYYFTAVRNQAVRQGVCTHLRNWRSSWGWSWFCHGF